MASFDERLAALIAEAEDGVPDDYDRWRERARALLIEHYGSGDHPEVQRFLHALFAGLVKSPDTVRSGRFAEAQAKAIRRSVAILEVLAEQVGRNARTTGEPGGALVSEGDRRSVFLVSGRDREANEALKELLRSLDIRVVEWQVALTETAEVASNPNPYVGEIVETGLRMAHSIVVLFTPDDLVHLRGDLIAKDDGVDEREERGQPRPNVIFEAGYASALAPGRLVMVAVGPVKLHSDILGRHIPRLDNSPESRLGLVQRLRVTGLAPNADGTDWLAAGQFPEYVSVTEPELADTLDAPEDVSALVVPDPEDDPPGFLEVLAEGEDAFPRMNAITVELAQEIRLMGELATATSKKVEESDARGAGSRGRLTAAIGYAHDLEPIADRTESLVDDFQREIGAVSSGVDYLLTRLATAGPDDDSIEARSAASYFVDSQIGLGEATGRALEGLGGMLDAMSTQEEMARPVRRQVSRVRAALERFGDASSATIGWARRAAEIRESEWYLPEQDRVGEPT